jgi:nitrogen fixation NifU-like protein
MTEVYSPRLLRHFRDPRNVGELPDPDRQAEVVNEACGDILRLTLAVSGNRIVEARFRCRGCAVAIAAGSAVTTLVTGRTVPGALALTVAEVEAALGGVPPGRKACLSLALRAVFEALGKS